MHTGHKAVLNDESDWIRLENHHDPIVDRELFEKANRLHPKKSRGVAETRTNYTLRKNSSIRRKEEKFSISEALRKREKYLEKLFFPQRVSQEKCLQM